MKNRKYFLEIGIVVVLIALIVVVRMYRGNPPALEMEPAKIKGNPAAKTFIVEFSDFSCPYCKRIQPILFSYVEMYPHDLKLIYKHFPLHADSSNSIKAVEAAECASDQGMFWQYSNLLFYNPRVWLKQNPASTEGFELMAKKIELDVKAFNDCLESGVKRQIAWNNRREGEGYLIHETPICLLNGRKILTNPADVAATKKEIEAAIAAAK